jgi:hypothetical protein
MSHGQGPYAKIGKPAVSSGVVPDVFCVGCQQPRKPELFLQPIERDAKKRRCEFCRDRIKRANAERRARERAA